MSIISKENFMTFEEIKLKISKQEIDTVLVCMVDMQGRLMGKRFHSEAFLEMAEDETHCCNYLLATDLEMATPDGYASTSWSKGCLLYTSPSPRDVEESRMPSSA